MSALGLLEQIANGRCCGDCVCDERVDGPRDSGPVGSLRDFSRNLMELVQAVVEGNLCIHFGIRPSGFAAADRSEDRRESVHCGCQRMPKKSPGGMLMR